MSDGGAFVSSFPHALSSSSLTRLQRLFGTCPLSDMLWRWRRSRFTSLPMLEGSSPSTRGLSPRKRCSRRVRLPISLGIPPQMLFSSKFRLRSSSRAPMAGGMTLSSPILLQLIRTTLPSSTTTPFHLATSSPKPCLRSSSAPPNEFQHLRRLILSLLEQCSGSRKENMCSVASTSAARNLNRGWSASFPTGGSSLRNGRTDDLCMKPRYCWTSFGCCK
mmetsp:Transcript_19309/g.38583  ORF Transcript_19309/g.38583 Transcript_19309/m.38583 type:complete len:219 (-) Transcript_19309:701-1357(-)